MPTGYTAGIATGEIDTFHDFALTCARNFGALIHMRDDAHGLDIRPDTVGTYHAERIAETKAEIVRLGALTKNEWQVEADAEHAKTVNDRAESALRQAAQAQRYRNMSAKVRAWTPPTADHENMKKFMLDQIEQSLNFDCGGDTMVATSAPQSGEQWYWARISSLSSSIAYHEKALREETERVNRNNLWVSQLRDSLTKGI